MPPPPKFRGRRVWQWTHHPDGKLEDNRKITMELVRRIIAEEMALIQTSEGDEQFGHIRYEQAGRLFEEIIAAPDFEEFLTLKAYAHLE